MDDSVEGVIRVGEVIPAINPDWTGNDPSTSSAPYRIFNIGNHSSLPDKGGETYAVLLQLTPSKMD